MSKTTASAAGEAMPATGLTQSRRSLLTALATAPLLGVVAAPATAKPETSPLPATSQTDAAMFKLRDKLANVRQQLEAIMDPHTEAELAMQARSLPQPQPTKPVGYDEWNKEWLELLKSHYKREPRLSDEEKGKDERAMKAWKARESRWRQKTGLRQVEAEMSRLHDEEDAITDAMIELPALSVAALKAKLTALQDDCDYPKLNDAILRDLTQMAGLPHLRISEF
jgi:hypothetical protein